MNKSIFKIVLVACLSLATVFVLCGILFVFGVIPWQDAEQSPVFVLLMCLLALAFVASSAYLLFQTFWGKTKTNAVLLDCKDDSATRADVKVIRSIVDGCARKVDGLKVIKMRLKENEKHGYALELTVKTKSDRVCQAVTEMRSLAEASFADVLGIKFDSLDIFVGRLDGKYVATQNLDEKSKDPIFDVNTLNDEHQQSAPPAEGENNDQSQESEQENQPANESAPDDETESEQDTPQEHTQSDQETKGEESE